MDSFLNKFAATLYKQFPRHQFQITPEDNTVCHILMYSASSPVSGLTHTAHATQVLRKQRKIYASNARSKTRLTREIHVKKQNIKAPKESILYTLHVVNTKKRMNVRNTLTRPGECRAVCVQCL